MSTAGRNGPAGEPEGLLRLRHQVEREGLFWRWGLRGQQSQDSTRSKRKGLQPSRKVFPMGTVSPPPACDLSWHPQRTLLLTGTQGQLSTRPFRRPQPDIRGEKVAAKLPALSLLLPPPPVCGREMDLAGASGLASLQPAGWLFQEARAEPRITPAAARAAKRSGKRRPFFGNTQPCPKRDPALLPAGARAASRCSRLGVEGNKRPGWAPSGLSKDPHPGGQARPGRWGREPSQPGNLHSFPPTTPGQAPGGGSICSFLKD